MTSTTRRHFVKALGTGVPAAVFPDFSLRRLASWLGSPPHLGNHVGDIPFTGEGRAAVGELTGTSHQGRLALDLSGLTSETAITGNDDFFIRTRYPDGLDHAQGAAWPIRVGGLVAASQTVLAADLDDRASSQGIVLLECSGNGRNRAFGLLSAAEWSGVPLSEVFDGLTPLDAARRVVISGVDRHSNVAAGSAGASWVFTFDQLEAAGAFLATRMNGAPLPRDHGAPVRLIVPGWYGCTMAKWVDEIRLVGDAEPATAQMQEYAARTHQDGIPELARDYGPATMDQTGMPIRVEKWRGAGGVEYRIVGIAWGGNRPTDAFRIRFNDDTPSAALQTLRQTTNRTWTLWSHSWRPQRPGTYRITLHVDDPTIRTRRLDRGFYARTVDITDVGR